MSEPGRGAGAGSGGAVPGVSHADPGSPGARVEAVIFDWGGTLTPWHEVDLAAGWYAYASVYDARHAASLAARLYSAEIRPWHDQHHSAGSAGAGHLDQMLRDAGIDLDCGRHRDALAAYLRFWDPHTDADPDAVPLLGALRERGIRIGVLSNTLWPRGHHEAVFARDGLLDLIDGAVYSSELPVGKPHEDAFAAALRAVGVTIRPERSSSAIGPGTTCTAPSRSACARSSCRTATSRMTSEAPLRGSRTPWCSASARCWSTWTAGTAERSVEVGLMLVGR